MQMNNDLYWKYDFCLKNYEFIILFIFYNMILLWKLPLCVHLDISIIGKYPLLLVCVLDPLLRSVTDFYFKQDVSFIDLS